MPIPAHHLRRGRIDAQAQRLADEALDRLADIGVGPHRPADLADRDRLTRQRESALISLQLGVPAERLEAKGGRLGMDAVGASNHRRRPMLDREPPHDLEQATQLALDDRGCVPELHGRRGIEQVGARQPEVQPSPLAPEALADRAHKGDHVVLALLLDLAHPLGID